MEVLISQPMKICETFIDDAPGQNIGGYDHEAAAVGLKTGVSDYVALNVDQKREPDKRTTTEVRGRAVRITTVGPFETTEPRDSLSNFLRVNHAFDGNILAGIANEGTESFYNFELTIYD